MRTLRGMTGFLALTLAVGACAGRTMDEPEDPAVNIRVVNELRPTTVLTIRVREGQWSDTLGTVVPSGLRTFRFHPRNMAGSFELLAETGTGRELTSPSFTLRENASVEWNVEANTVLPR